MSRIEEALRKAGSPSVPHSSIAAQDPFVPAWTLAMAASDGGGDNRGPEAQEPSELLTGGAYASVRSFNAEWRERLAIGSQRNGVLTEQFRRLAATLHHAQASSGLRTIMVTSAAAEDGKTLTAVNLALVLSDSYQRRVLLIDADLRRPSIGNITDVTGLAGLSETLKAKSEQKLGLVQLTRGLSLLPAGQPDPDPIAGLTSVRMRQILIEAASRFDWVVLDAPPVGSLADASLLAEMTDGTLFVVRVGRTHYALVQKGIEAVGRERILGVVLNGVERMPLAPYEHYYRGLEPAGVNKDPA